MLVLLLATALLVPPRAQAGLLDRLGRFAGEAGEVSAHALSRAEAIAMARTVSPHALHVELAGDRLVLHAVQGGPDATFGRGDDLAARLREALESAAGGHSNVITLTDDTARALGTQLDLLAAQAEVRVLHRGLQPLRLVRLAQPGHPPQTFLALAPGLVVPVEARLTNTMVSVLGAELRRDAVRAVPLFSRADVETFATLARVAGDRLLDAAPLLDDRARSARVLKDRILVVIGHVEGDAFAIRGPSGALEHRVPFRDIETLALKSDAALLLSIGCSCYAAGSSSGFLRPITDLDAARALRGALEARTHAEFLGRLGTLDNPFVISGSVLDRVAAEEASRVLRMERFSTPANGAARSVEILARDIPVDWLATIWPVIQGWYAIGAAGLLLMFRWNRAGFLARFPVLPNAVLDPGGHRLHLLLREAMYWPLAPFVAGAVAFAILLGGWQYRESLHRHLWTQFFAPHEFLYETGFLLLVLLASFGPLLLTLAASIVLLATASQHEPGWQAALLALATLVVGGVLGFWTYARLPERIAGRIGRFRGRYPRAAFACGIGLPVLLAACGLAAAIQ